ncbi:MAG: hypothetical protein R3200_16030 [Xanthomonadales bacterium]|nr:hypothetical protein [Xanthomonadales bacterium]
MRILVNYRHSTILLCALLAACAGRPADPPDAVATASGPNRCEYVRKKGSHIKHLRCARPRNKAERLRSLSGAVGDSQVSCSGGADICRRIRETDG